MNWEQAIAAITPHVVKITTPSGHGTGFLTLYNQAGTWCGIATAAHVVSAADEWQQPIRIIHSGSKSPAFLKESDRVIFINYENDSAIVLCPKGELQLPETPITLLPADVPCGTGVDVGWLGYPAIEPTTLCFFSGTVSARQTGGKSYLIDGVAIHGVSGGPVFHCPTPDSIQIIGCVSAYHANRVTGETLPGLLMARDVSHFHNVIQLVKNVDEARAKKAELEAPKKREPIETVEAANPTEPAPEGAGGV